MAKAKEITISQSKGAFSIFKRAPSKKKDYDFSGILGLRQILSNEKARILHTIKTQHPKSIYELAKKLERGFKSVNDDVKVLEHFGFINLKKETTKKRPRLKPELATDTVTIHFKI